MKTEFPDWKELVKRARHRKGIPEHMASPEAVVEYAHMILAQLEKAFEEKKQTSFFLRGCDLMTHSIDIYDERQKLYIKYCKALMCDAGDVGWEKLADYVLQLLLKPENLREKSFVQDTVILLDMGLDVYTFVNHLITMGNAEGLKMGQDKDTPVEVADRKGTSAFQLAREAPNRSMLLLMYEHVKGEILQQNIFYDLYK
jgi:hypothetical protein